MILSVYLFSSDLTLIKRIRYFPYDLEIDIIRQIIKYSHSLPTLAYEEPILSLVTFTWMSPDGATLKFAVAHTNRAYVLILADELETDASLVSKASSIAVGLDEIIDSRTITRLDVRTQQSLISFVNELVLDFVRFTLFGPPRVGKTSVFSLLTRGELQPLYTPSTKPKVAPTLGRYSELLSRDDFADSEEWFIIANRVLTIYDLPGAYGFHKRWSSYLRRADVGVLVIRSSRRGVAHGQLILEKFKYKLPKLIIVIANQQDLPHALPPEQIQKVIGHRVYGMVANDLDRVDHLRDLFKTVAITRIQMTSTISVF